MKVLFFIPVFILGACGPLTQSLRHGFGESENAEAGESMDQQVSEDEGEGEIPSDLEEDHDKNNGLDKPDEPDPDENPMDPVDPSPESLEDKLDFKLIEVAEANKLDKNKRKFLWPVDGWLTSTYYRVGNKKKHGGSADITIPFGTPIMATRSGTVVSSTKSITKLGGYLVKIDHGDGYRSLYSHLVLPSPLKVGQKVKTGEYVGRVGRTGNANTTHLHFAIYRKGVVVEIPGIKHGDWVQQGDVIPGDYPELSPIDAVRGSYVVKSLFDQSGYDVPGTSAKTKGSFAKGKLFRIKAAKKGSFQAESGEWLPMGGIITGGFNIYHLRVKKKTKVYTAAKTSSTVYNELSVGTLLTGFRSEGSFERVLMRKGSNTCKFLYVPKDAVERTPKFKTLLPASTIIYYSKPSFDAPRVVNRGYVYAKKEAPTVYENKDGWFRISYQSNYVWLPSIMSSGPR